MKIGLGWRWKGFLFSHELGRKHTELPSLPTKVAVETHPMGCKAATAQPTVTRQEVAPVIPAVYPRGRRSACSPESVIAGEHFYWLKRPAPKWETAMFKAGCGKGQESKMAPGVLEMIKCSLISGFPGHPDSMAKLRRNHIL